MYIYFFYNRNHKNIKVHFKLSNNIKTLYNIIQLYITKNKHSQINNLRSRDYSFSLPWQTKIISFLGR